MDVETEIRELKRRVGDLEGAVNVLTGQLQRVRPDLTALREATFERLERVEGVLGRVDERLETVGSRIAALDLKVWSLRDDMPALMAEALRSTRDQLD